MPEQQLVLSVALTVAWVTENGIQCEIETVSFSVQLISCHISQATEICLIHCQQRRRQLSNKVV